MYRTAMRQQQKLLQLIKEGRAEILMKGSLHTDELMSAIVSRDGGLRTARRISHVFVMDVPTYHKVLIVTDGAINIAPTLEDKVDICQNAIDLAISLGLEKPKVAILAQSKQSPRRCRPRSMRPRFARWLNEDRSRAACLDGPLAFDNAISKQAAQTKGIKSRCCRRSGHSAGSGSRSRKHPGQATELSRERRQRGMVLGARVPVILTSRADSVRSRIASCAVAILVAHARRVLKACRRRSAMDDYALVLNAGSSSLKFCVFQRPARRRLATGSARPDRRYRHVTSFIC